MHFYLLGILGRHFFSFGLNNTLLYIGITIGYVYYSKWSINAIEGVPPKYVSIIRFEFLYDVSENHCGTSITLENWGVLYLLLEILIMLFYTLSNL